MTTRDALVREIEQCRAKEGKWDQWFEEAIDELLERCLTELRKPMTTMQRLNQAYLDEKAACEKCKLGVCPVHV